MSIRRKTHVICLAQEKQELIKPQARNDWTVIMRNRKTWKGTQAQDYKHTVQGSTEQPITASKQLSQEPLDATNCDPAFAHSGACSVSTGPIPLLFPH